MQRATTAQGIGNGTSKCNGSGTCGDPQPRDRDLAWGRELAPQSRRTGVASTGSFDGVALGLGCRGLWDVFSREFQWREGPALRRIGCLWCEPNIRIRCGAQAPSVRNILVYFYFALLQQTRLFPAHRSDVISPLPPPESSLSRAVCSLLRAAGRGPEVSVGPPMYLT